MLNGRRDVNVHYLCSFCYIVAWTCLLYTSYDDVRPVTRADEVILEAFPYDEESLKQQMGLSELLRGTRGLDLKKQLYMEPSISVCGLEAGQMYRGARGIVPCEASARVSFYLVADQSPERVRCV